MEKEQSVLVIFPHPDDEAFGVSGTIALHTQAGTPVTYACLTLGEMGRNMGNPPFANRESLPEIRKAELADAVKILGIQDLRMVGLRDKTIEFEEDEKMTKLMLSFIEEVKPSLVITFYPGYSVHPDHEACGAAVVRAIAEMPASARPKLHCVAFSNNCVEELGEPDVVHDVSSVSDIKMAAIEAHRSQTQLMVADMAEKIRNNDQQTINWIQQERFWTYKF